MKKEDKRQPVDVTASFLRELEAIDAAKLRVTELKEQELENRKFPIRYNPDLPGWSFEKYEWSEAEIRKFYEDPINVARTIYCKAINVDELDDWGMSGYEPGFIYIEGVRYKGASTLADEAATLGLSMATDPGTGLGVMNHFDYFPRHKFDY